METNNNELEELKKRIAELEESKKKSVFGPQFWTISVPIIVAVIGGLWTYYSEIQDRAAQRELEKTQFENNLVLEAIEGETSQAKRENLQILVGMNLLSKDRVQSLENSLEDSYVGLDGFVYFLSGKDSLLEGMLLYRESIGHSADTNFLDAARFADWAIRHDSTNFNYYTQLGFCYNQIGRVDDALKAYE